MEEQNFNNGYEKSGQTQGQNGYIQNQNGQPLVSQQPVYNQNANGQNYEQNPYKQNVYGQNPYEQNAYGQNPYEQNSYGQNPYGQNGYVQNGYGQPYPQGMYGQPVYQQPRQISGLSIAGLVLGILGLVSSFILNWVSALIALVGLVLSIIGQAMKKSGLGIAAIILSVLGLLAGVGFFVWYLHILSQNGFWQMLQYY